MFVRGVFARWMLIFVENMHPRGEILKKIDRSPAEMLILVGNMYPRVKFKVSGSVSRFRAWRTLVREAKNEKNLLFFALPATFQSLTFS